MKSCENNTTHRASNVPTISFQAGVCKAHFKSILSPSYAFKNKSDMTAIKGYTRKTKKGQDFDCTMLKHSLVFYIAFPIRLFKLGRKLSKTSKLLVMT